MTGAKVVLIENGPSPQEWKRESPLGASIRHGCGNNGNNGETSRKNGGEGTLKIIQAQAPR